MINKLYNLNKDCTNDIIYCTENNYEKVCYNLYNKKHRVDGPAVMHRDGAKIMHRDGAKIWYINGKLHRAWYLNGKLHREDGPAIEYFNGDREWYFNGKLHREDGPAIQYSNRVEKWYFKGKLHRLDGPAFIKPDGTMVWYKNGLLHREDGPAVELSIGNKQWFYEGLPYYNENYLHFEFIKNNKVYRDFIVPSYDYKVDDSNVNHMWIPIVRFDAKNEKIYSADDMNINKNILINISRYLFNNKTSSSNIVLVFECINCKTLFMHEIYNDTFYRQSYNAHEKFNEEINFVSAKLSDLNDCKKQIIKQIL